MSLQYYLVPNRMTSEPDDYMAVSVNSETYELDDVFELMTRKGSTLREAEAMANFHEMMGTIMDLLKQGHAVNTPLMRFSTAVAGPFTGDQDRFDPNRHTVRIHANPGTELREIAGDIEVEKVAARTRQPVLMHYHDNQTETEDSIITPLRGGRITGSLLKFDEDDPQQGVFFINTADDTETRVEGRLLKNKPGELIFNNPDLPAGTYSVQVRSQVPDTTSVSSGTLKDELSVPGS